MNKRGMLRDLPNQELPRERLIKQGVGTLSNSELLAILLGTGTREISAIGLANHLLALDKEGISYLASCQPEDLSSVKGVGKAKACQIISAIELGKRISSRPKSQKVKISTPEDAAMLLMEELRYQKREYFKTILLNSKNELILIDTVSIGTLNSSLVHPREVFTNPLKKSASTVIFVHNHPSGNPTPSQQDIDITNRLIEAGKILGINVVDHIIIGDGIFKSMKENFLI